MFAYLLSLSVFSLFLDEVHNRSFKSWLIPEKPNSIRDPVDCWSWKDQVLRELNRGVDKPALFVVR